MAKFYLVKDGQRIGPLSIEQLVNEGLTPESLVWNDGMTDWAPAGQVAELASVFAQAPQPQQPYVQSRQAVINNNEQQSDKEKNGYAILGFILSLLSFVLGLFISEYDSGFKFVVFSAILGLWYSIKGVRKEPKGLAIAGIVISGLVIVLVVIGLAT